MERIWTDLHDAAVKVLKPREVSRMIEAGGVAAAVESASGKIFDPGMVAVNRKERL